jgi:transcriptional regulator with XRE-family HTH domain
MTDDPKQVNPPERERELTQDKARLKRRRLAAGLTLREAAERARCDFSTIGKLEKGTRSAGAHMLAALAGAYGCEITDLMPPEQAVA